MPFCDVLRSVLRVLRVLLSAVLLFCPFCQIIEKGIKTMSKNEYAVLRNIMHDLKDGYVFGKDYTWDYYDNKPYRYPFFGSALYLTPAKNIGYTHYGSSATKLTLKNLEWIITVIFEMTPSAFLREYIRNDKSTIKS